MLIHLLTYALWFRFLVYLGCHRGAGGTLIVQKGGVFKPASTKGMKVLSEGAWECAQNTQLLLWLFGESFGEGGMSRLKKMEFVIGNAGKFWELLVDSYNNVQGKVLWQHDRHWSSTHTNVARQQPQGWEKSCLKRTSVVQILDKECSLGQNCPSSVSYLRSVWIEPLILISWEREAVSEHWFTFRKVYLKNSGLGGKLYTKKENLNFGAKRQEMSNAWEET